MPPALSPLLPDRPRRLALLDPHPVLRLGLEVLLSQHSGVQVCASFADEAPLLELLQQDPHAVDLLVIDALPLGDLGDGLALLRELTQRWPRLPVLVLSAHCNASTVATAMQAARTSRRAVSFCCTGLGAPSSRVGTQRAFNGRCQDTTNGSWLPAGGTATMPMPARKRESRVRASCMLPQISRSPCLRRTSPANTLNTSSACGSPDQPSGGASTVTCWRSPDSISGVQARCGVGSSVAAPTSRQSRPFSTVRAWPSHGAASTISNTTSTAPVP